MKEEYEITMLDTIEYRFKVDEDTKKEFDKLYDEVGLIEGFEYLEKEVLSEEGGIPHMDYELGGIREVNE